MAARSSSSDYDFNSTGEKLQVALDSSDDGRISEAENSSFRRQLNNSQKAKGMAIISRATEFDEISGGEVGTIKNLEAETSHMVGINDLQITMRNHGSLSDRQGVETDRVGSPFIECGCCFWKFPFENMVHCSNGHPFCFRCLKRQVEEIIYGGLRADAYLSCMSTHYCNVSIPMSEIRRALPNDVIERYEDRQAQEAIAEAKLEGLVYCPFCSIPYVVDVKCVEVLDCPNPKCLKASCIQCKKPSHIPLQCKEVEKLCDSYPRTEVEERMSKAVIRECSVCHAEIIKMDGCNKMRCRCGNIMCYVCRQTVSLSAFNHFCFCHVYSRAEPRKTSCNICNKCSFVQNEEEDNEALAEKEEAFKELVENEPKLLDLEIGPPFNKLRQQTPLEQQQEHHMQPPQHLPLQHKQPPPQHLPLQHMQPPPQHLDLGVKSSTIYTIIIGAGLLFLCNVILKKTCS